MLPPGAAEADGQITLALVDVMGQQVNQQFGDALDELLRLRERPNVFGNARVTSGKWAEFGHEVWIGQEADVEDEVGVFGNSVTEAETDAGNEYAFLRSFLVETFRNVGAELVNVEF